MLGVQGPNLRRRGRRSSTRRPPCTEFGSRRYSVRAASIHSLAERNCLENLNKAHFGVPGVSKKRQEVPLLPRFSDSWDPEVSLIQVFQTVSEVKFPETRPAP